MKKFVLWILLSVACLFLSRLASAEPQPLDLLLDKTAKEVSLYLDRVSDVRCTEQVQQIKLDKNGHSEHTENGVYDYFVLLQGGEDELLLNESRIPKREPKERKNMPMLISNGFSMLYLVFHPYYRNSFRFEPESDEVIDGHLYRRVHFDHIPGNRTPAAISVRGREYPLDLTGEAWFDSATGMITRIQAHLNNDMHDVGLRSLRAEIDYAPVKLPDWPQTYRFPTLATVEVETLRQHWKNVHHFTEYKRFLVDTQETVTAKAIGTQ